MSTERDELAEDIRGLGITVIDGPPVDLSEPLAQHLHSLGYRKPRTITTTEELLALPAMSVVHSNAGSIANIVDGQAFFFGYQASVPATQLALPATVLFAPGAVA